MEDFCFLPMYRAEEGNILDQKKWDGWSFQAALSNQNDKTRQLCAAVVRLTLDLVIMLSQI